MVSQLFIGLGVFYRTRARAHAYGETSKRFVFSLFFFALPAILFAAGKDELFTLLNHESDAKMRISYLARLTAAHVNATDVTKIEPFLQDSDARVRAQAVVTLGAIGGKHVVEDLTKILSGDSDAGVRIAAAFWLGSLKDPSAVSALDHALAHDTEANVRAQSAQALKQIGTAGARSALGRGKSDKDKRVKRLANEP